MFWDILFYGIIIIGAALLIGLTVYRIDWARHPEKYKDLVEDPEKAAYRQKKEADKKAAAKKAKEKEKALKRQKRVDKVNHYRAINGKPPLAWTASPRMPVKRRKSNAKAPRQCRGAFLLYDPSQTLSPPHSRPVSWAYSRSGSRWNRWASASAVGRSATISCSSIS